MKEGSNLKAAVTALEKEFAQASEARGELQRVIIEAMDKAADVEKVRAGYKRAINILNAAPDMEAV